jgi:hypothetical protein
MQFVFSLSCDSPLFNSPKNQPVVPPSSSLSRAKWPCIRLSTLSTAGHKSAANNQIKKRTPPTINTRDLYVQSLYARGWGPSGILPNRNSIAVLSKRFEFENAEDLFLADLSEYEEKRHWQARSRSISTFHLSCPLPEGTVRLPIVNVLNGFQHHAKMNVFGDQYIGRPRQQVNARRSKVRWESGGLRMRRHRG